MLYSDEQPMESGIRRLNRIGWRDGQVKTIKSTLADKCKKALPLEFLSGRIITPLFVSPGNDDI